MLNRENALLIDIRNQKAFSDGHILGAMNIARADIDQNLTKLAAYKDRTLIVVGDSDMEASSASTKLRRAGFAKICVLANGLSSWKDAQLPLSKNQ